MDLAANKFDNSQQLAKVAHQSRVLAEARLYQISATKHQTQQKKLTTPHRLSPWGLPSQWFRFAVVDMLCLLRCEYACFLVSHLLQEVFQLLVRLRHATSMERYVTEIQDNANLSILYAGVVFLVGEVRSGRSSSMMRVWGWQV